MKGTLDAPVRGIALFLYRTTPRGAWQLGGKRDLDPGPVEINIPVYWLAQGRGGRGGLTPGSYSLQVFEYTASSSGSQGVPDLSLVPGPEGLVGRAWVSRTRNGPPVPVRASQADLTLSIVNRSPDTVWVHFSFLVAPKSGPLVVSWYDPKNRLLGTRKKGIRAGRFSTFLRMSNGRHLPYGKWRCVLRARGIPVGLLRIQTLRGSN